MWNFYFFLTEISSTSDSSLGSEKLSFSRLQPFVQHCSLNRSCGVSFFSLVETAARVTHAGLWLVHRPVNNRHRAQSEIQPYRCGTGRSRRAGTQQRELRTPALQHWVQTVPAGKPIWSVLSNRTGTNREQPWKWRSQTARRSFLRTCPEREKPSRSWPAEVMLKVKCHVHKMDFKDKMMEVIPPIPAVRC